MKRREHFCIWNIAAWCIEVEWFIPLKGIIKKWGDVRFCLILQYVKYLDDYGNKNKYSHISSVTNYCHYHHTVTVAIALIAARKKLTAKCSIEGLLPSWRNLFYAKIKVYCLLEKEGALVYMKHCCMVYWSWMVHTPKRNHKEIRRLKILFNSTICEIFRWLWSFGDKNKCSHSSTVIDYYRYHHSVNVAVAHIATRKKLIAKHLIEGWLQSWRNLFYAKIKVYCLFEKEGALVYMKHRCIVYSSWMVHTPKRNHKEIRWLKILLNSTICEIFRWLRSFGDKNEYSHSSTVIDYYRYHHSVTVAVALITARKKWTAKTFNWWLTAILKTNTLCQSKSLMCIREGGVPLYLKHRYIVNWVPIWKQFSD